MQLAGAIVVDSVGAPATANDRIFVLSWWYTVDTTSPTGLGSGTMAINGLSWPHTEHLTYTQNDSVRWRVINVTGVDHPMHLHGFYFQVGAHGDGNIDTTYGPDQRRLAVTEALDAGQTMAMAWLPSRPGNWIWHCHYAGHVSDESSLDKVHGTMDTMAMQQHTSDRPHEMYGLVMGITVTPKGVQVADTRPPRPIRLELTETPHTFGNFAAYTFALDGSKPAAPGAMGPTIFLTRNERVSITVVNHTQEGAAVHWHGIELESPADGVPSWSGAGKKIFPMVQPGDSYTVSPRSCCRWWCDRGWWLSPFAQWRGE